MNINSGNMCGFEMDYYDNDMLGNTTIKTNKLWEPELTNFVKTIHQKFGIRNIIDVGANFGYHTLLFSKEVSENVYSFEPQLQNFQLLQRNVKNNNVTNVKLFNLACGDTNCDVQMPLITDWSVVENMGDFTPNVIKDSYSITKSIVLDDMDFKNIDLIKIDVQGWEKKVLHGTRNILKEYKPALIVEFEWFQLKKTNTTCEELYGFIRKQNYYIFQLESPYPADQICIHNDRLAEFREKFKEYIFPNTFNSYLNNDLYNGVNEKIVML